MNQTPILRPETPADTRAVEILTREAFWNAYRPGCDEHYLVHMLRRSPAFLPLLNFVAELDGRIVGNIMYSRAKIALDAGGELPVISFGPISVLPERQKQGVGSAMIRHTLGLATRQGHKAVLIYGDPAYYSRVGFQPAERYGIASDGNEYCDALQAFALQPGALQAAPGRFIEDPVFTVDPEKAAAFDQLFPYKEKYANTAAQQRFQQIASLHRPRETQAGPT